MRQFFDIREPWLGLGNGFWAAAAVLALLATAGGPAFAQTADERAKAGDARGDSGAAANQAGPDRTAEGASAAGVELGQGRLIRVRLPLVGNADEHVKAMIRRARDKFAALPKQGDRRPVLILELTPARRDAASGEGTDFSRALSLAKFLTSNDLASVRTVAYVPRTIKGHGVLVALACEEIIMHPDAEIGEAGIDEDGGRAVPEAVVSFYRNIAQKRRPAYEPVVLGMLDQSLRVLKVETEVGPEFILASELDDLKERRTIVDQQELFAGGLRSLTARGAREYGLVRTLVTSPDELARDLALPREAVIEDQSLVGDWEKVIIPIEGPITPRVVRQVSTLIGSEIKQNSVNLIVFRIDSGGGELVDCLQLADKAAALRPDEVQTVAYVPVEAAGGAALIALACDQLVMHPEARIGGAGSVMPDSRTIEEAIKSIRGSLAKNTVQNWSLLAAFVDPQLELFSYHNTKTGEVRYFCDEEFSQLQDAADWQKGPRIKPAGELMQLSSERARELGVAWQVVDSYDEFKLLYGYDSDSEPREARPSWALELVEALSSPALAMLLLVIGFIGIYIELHTPGIGAGAFVSAVAFMLYFWSNFLHGTAEWLEVLLFLGGLFFLALEVLVLPGFGIFGLGGGVMILVSLVLASQTMFLPQTESQVAELRRSLTIVTASIVATVAGAIALRRYLPQAPVFRTLLLNPPPEEELIDLDYRESLAEFSHLVGQQGTTTTKLMPAGKAEFDGQLVDVIAEGVPIERGRPVVVVKARGSRVVVRAVGE
jgi:membrane-bound ClpP family serine protease